MTNENGTDSGKIMARRKLRSLAFHFLYAADRFDYTVPIDKIVESFKVGYNVDIDEDSMAVEIARGTIEKIDELDDKIKPMLKNWKIERLGCCTLLILRLAVWELEQDGAVPSIIINEAIELAKCFAEKDAYKFVNGILDEIRKKFNIVEEPKIEK